MSRTDENTGHPDTERRPPAAARITPLADGPLLVEGPVEIVAADGTVRRSDRPVVALCMCRRSLRQPFCDTSHRPRLRATRATGSSGGNGNASNGTNGSNGNKGSN
ncbi:CDGSH iron-sulfur domain-containing protein [Streptomyces sp. NPDC053431]|uniref:CDGSH iron-sulfur domain-containing protein n=1 Tax=Streptomyces sp. NPDC053431 TaxID=3365703 RepID=UPI0037D25B71